MNSNKSRNIVIGFVAVVIVFLLFKRHSDDNLHHQSGDYPPTHPSSSYYMNDSDELNSSFYCRPSNPPNPTRHEVLQTKVKGYREATYWGSEQPIDVEARYMSDDEFTSFIEDEVELKDTDVYWGAAY